MSVAALVDAANAAAAQGKTGDPAAFVLGLRPPSVTPPLVASTVLKLESSSSSSALKMEIKSEHPALSLPTGSLPTGSLPTGSLLTGSLLTGSLPTATRDEVELNAKSPALADVRVKLEPSASPGAAPAAPVAAPAPAASSVNSAGCNNVNNKPVHKLKTAWLQRHTGQPLFYF